MEEIIKGLECVEVTYTSDKKKATLTFYDDERGEIREVNYTSRVMTPPQRSTLTTRKRLRKSTR